MLMIASQSGTWVPSLRDNLLAFIASHYVSRSVGKGPSPWVSEIGHKMHIRNSREQNVVWSLFRGRRKKYMRLRQDLWKTLISNDIKLLAYSVPHFPQFAWLVKGCGFCANQEADPRCRIKSNQCQVCTLLGPYLRLVRISGNVRSCCVQADANTTSSSCTNTGFHGVNPDSNRRDQSVCVSLGCPSFDLKDMYIL
jgi:hypothetical protein